MAKRKTRQDFLTENLELQEKVRQIEESFKKEKEDLLSIHLLEKENLKKEWEEKYEKQKGEYGVKMKNTEDEKNKQDLQWKEKLNNQTSEFEGKIKALEEEKDFKILDLEEEKKVLHKECENKQRQIDFQETKKLAKAYEDQKKEYKSNSVMWFNHLTFIVSILAISTFTSFIYARRVVWYERLEYYLIDFILISAVWFCAKQYSYYIKLYSDFANRQALAQSYYNIINSTEDVDIKERFVEKAADVLCMHNSIEHRDNLPIEKLLSTTLETLSVVKKIK